MSPVSTVNGLGCDRGGVVSGILTPFPMLMLPTSVLFNDVSRESDVVLEVSEEF